MSSTFAGFSEEDLKRIKSGESSSKSEDLQIPSNVRKIDKIGNKPKRVQQYKLPALQKHNSDDNIDALFEKCKLSIKTPTSPNNDITNDTNNNNDIVDETSREMDADNNQNNINVHEEENITTPLELEIEKSVDIGNTSDTMIESDIRRTSSVSQPDIVRCADNYTEDEIAVHKMKLQELQLQQKIMEEQNKKRKEMLAKALADRTKQTEEEVLRLEKIKRELQVLDGQFSLDVAVLRKKIDQACLTYADAEKHYLKVEKEFLQAKIQLQKEKEKKELLTEHLCALITHNETRKAQKLETLMLELASDKKVKNSDRRDPSDVIIDEDEKPVIVDGVDQKTGKIVEFPA